MNQHSVAADVQAPQHIGRPSRAKAMKRQEELFDKALDLFLEKGFEQTTMDMIAASVGMTKRTIYSRFEDKSAFFTATVMRAIERMVESQATFLLRLEPEPLETVLASIARMRIQQVTTRDGVRLQRIVNAETFRFPEIYRMAQRHISKPVHDFLADYLERHAVAGGIHVPRPDMAAAAFMNMVSAGAIRQIGLGNQIDDAENEKQIHFSIDLFLNGIKRP